MTELEKIEYTKSFIDDLANGINPLDGTPVPDGELLNNVRISRCMFYVSDILRQVIEKGGVKPQKKEKKAPFEITSEQLERFEYSDKPIPLSEIAKRLKALIDTEKMQRLTYKALAAWLIDIGALKEKENDEGKKKKYPTDMGKSLGISEEKRSGMYGDYIVVVYNREAQQFVIDNLSSVIAMKNK